MMAEAAGVAQILRDVYPDHTMFVQQYCTDGEWRDSCAVDEHGHIEWIAIGQRVAWMGSRTAAFRIGHVIQYKLSVVSIEWDEKNPDFMPRFTHWTEREFLLHERLGHLRRLPPNLEET